MQSSQEWSQLASIWEKNPNEYELLPWVQTRQGPVLVRPFQVNDHVALNACLPICDEWASVGETHQSRAVQGTYLVAWRVERLVDGHVKTRPVGHVLIKTRSDYQHAANAFECFAYVSRVVVAETERGQGVGRSLMNAAHDVANAMGFVGVGLAVDVQNKIARSLYESDGYLFWNEGGVFNSLRPAVAMPSVSNQGSVTNEMGQTQIAAVASKVIYMVKHFALEAAA